MPDPNRCFTRSEARRLEIGFRACIGSDLENSGFPELEESVIASRFRFEERPTGRKGEFILRTRS